jgi:hypothetical protein
VAVEAQNVCRFQEVGIIFCAVHVMATEAGDAVRIHRAGHEIVALHSIFVGGSVCEVREGLLAKLVIFQLPIVR